MAHILKLFERVIDSQIRLEYINLDCQYRCRHGYGTMDLILAQGSPRSGIGRRTRLCISCLWTCRSPFIGCHVWWSSGHRSPNGYCGSILTLSGTCRCWRYETIPYHRRNSPRIFPQSISVILYIRRTVREHPRYIWANPMVARMLKISH